MENTVYILWDNGGGVDDPSCLSIHLTYEGAEKKKNKLCLGDFEDFEIDILKKELEG